MLIQETRLAGMTLEELRDQYRYDLFEDFLRFWFPRARSRRDPAGSD